GGEPSVEEAVLGIEEEDPAQRHREGREEKGGPEGELEPVTPGQIGAREEPGEEDGQGEGEELTHEGHGEGVDEGGAKAGLAESGPPAVEAVTDGLPGRRDLEALQGHEHQREYHDEGDQGEDEGAEHALQLEAPRPGDLDGLCQAGHTLTISGGKPSWSRSPSRHSRARERKSTMRCSPRLTLASSRSPTKESVSMTPGSWFACLDGDPRGLASPASGRMERWALAPVSRATVAARRPLRVRPLSEPFSSTATRRVSPLAGPTRPRRIAVWPRKSRTKAEAGSS